MSSERKLLGVSWCMPPALFPRSIQVARLLKGLARLGWHSTVVTPEDRCRPAADPFDVSLAEAYAGAYAVVPVDLSRVDPEFGPWRQRWQQRWNGEADLALDQLWLKRAVPVATRAVRDHRPDVLVSFAQPWSDHHIGLQVAASQSGLPWVAHFSDPWADSPYSADLPDEVRAQARDQEARVVARADRIVFTNPYALDLVMAKYSATLRAKARVVPHAMDDELAASLPAPVPMERGRLLTLAYVGNLFLGKRRAHAVFEALAALQARRPLAGRLRLEIVGGGSGLYEARLKAFELNLDAIVTFRPQVSYLESLAAMRNAGVLVLIDAAADINLFLPSKVADYLTARRPVLAITPPVGPSADIMRHSAYPVVAPDDVDGIAVAIEQLLNRHEAAMLGPSVESVAASAPFELGATSRSFAAILDELTNRGA